MKFNDYHLSLLAGILGGLTVFIFSFIFEEFYDKGILIVGTLSVGSLLIIYLVSVLIGIMFRYIGFIEK